MLISEIFTEFYRPLKMDKQAALRLCQEDEQEEVESFSWKTIDRLLYGLYGMLSSMKITLLKISCDFLQQTDSQHKCWQTSKRRKTSNYKKFFFDKTQKT